MKSLTLIHKLQRSTQIIAIILFGTSQIQMERTRETRKIAPLRVLQVLCYFIGSTAFLLASVIASPLIFKPFDATEFCSRIYGSGSVFFIFSYTLEFFIRPQLQCKGPARTVFNKFLMIIGFAIFILGSSYHSEEAGPSHFGEKIYAGGSSLLAIAYCLELLKLLNKDSNWWWQNLKDNANEFLANFFAAFASFMYAMGSCLFLELKFELRSLSLITTTCYIVGGVSFVLSALFIIKEYFWDSPLLDAIDHEHQISHHEMRQMI